jgi:hypothetical protein
MKNIDKKIFLNTTILIARKLLNLLIYLNQVNITSFFYLYLKFEDSFNTQVSNNILNVTFIRDRTHIFNVLRFKSENTMSRSLICRCRLLARYCSRRVLEHETETLVKQKQTSLIICICFVVLCNYII